MRKTLIVCVLLLAAQIFAVGHLFAQDESLKLRVELFARAVVAENMRVRGPAPSLHDLQATPYLDDIERDIASIEDKVDIFIKLNQSKKKEAILNFRQMLIDKCCKLTGKSRGQYQGYGADQGGLKERPKGGGFGGGGGGGGGRRRALQNGGGGGE